MTNSRIHRKILSSNVGGKNKSIKNRGNWDGLYIFGVIVELQILDCFVELRSPRNDKREKLCNNFLYHQLSCKTVHQIA